MARLKSLGFYFHYLFLKFKLAPDNLSGTMVDTNLYILTPYNRKFNYKNHAIATEGFPRLLISYQWPLS